MFVFSAKSFLDPCAWCWLGLIAGAWYWWWKNQRRRAMFWIAIAGIISLGTALQVPRKILSLKEKCYWDAAAQPGFLKSLSGAEAVVMCGGVLEISSNDFSGANYGETVDRFLKAVQLAQQFAIPLVLGGGEAEGPGSPLESSFERHWLDSWGLTNLVVLNLGICHTTHEEALAAARLAKRKGWHKIVLVTSGYHMDRALGVFRKAGLDVLPAACDFRGMSSQWNSPSCNLIPNAGEVEAIRLFLCEEVGELYYHCRGWM